MEQFKYCNMDIVRHVNINFLKVVLHGGIVGSELLTADDEFPPGLAWWAQGSQEVSECSMGGGAWGSALTPTEMKEKDGPDGSAPLGGDLGPWLLLTLCSSSHWRSPRGCQCVSAKPHSHLRRVSVCFIMIIIIIIGCKTALSWWFL